MTGIDDPYEPPLAAEIVCNTDSQSLRETSSQVVAQILEYLSATSASAPTDVNTRS